jgi:hypothetical protein
MILGVPSRSFYKSAGRLVALFVISAGILLLLTGAAKIASAFGRAPILAKPDPIFGIQFNYLLLSVGLMEVAVAFVCFAHTNQNLALVLVAAISINFLGYRVALWLTHWPGYCPCLGTLTQTIHLSPKRADSLTQVMLTYLLLGSVSLLACAWWALIRKKANTIPRGRTLLSDSSDHGGFEETRNSETKKTTTKTTMNNQNQPIVNKTLSLLSICVLAPCLYAQCVTDLGWCYYSIQGGSCYGTGAQAGVGDASIHLAGGSCGTEWIGGVDTGRPCGSAISGLCA